MQQLLYNTMLYLAAGINLMMAFVLVYGNYEYRNYDVYRRSRFFSALAYVAFAVGFLLHAHFQWRTSWPEAATALSVSYFHIGAVCFGWSHTSLLNPNYLTQGVAFRDLLILVAGLTAYWITLDNEEFSIMNCQLSIVNCELSIVNCELSIVNYQFSIFFLHAGFIAFTFYRTYFRVRRDIERMPAGGNAPRWWTPEAKRSVLLRHHSFAVGSHLIILFGLGSGAITACFPTQTWPYILLLAAAILVFTYIFYALFEYGIIIEAATNATEDAEDPRYVQ